MIVNKINNVIIEKVFVVIILMKRVRLEQSNHAGVKKKVMQAEVDQILLKTGLNIIFQIDTNLSTFSNCEFAKYDSYMTIIEF